MVVERLPPLPESVDTEEQRKSHNYAGQSVASGTKRTESTSRGAIDV